MRLPIYSSGMGRCCIEQIMRYTGPSPEGFGMRCFDCNAPLRIRAGAWEWAASAPIVTDDPNNLRLEL